MKETKEISGAGKFFLFLFGLGADIFKAFVISKFWTWFLAPLGVIEINVAQALALVFFLSFFSSSKKFDWSEMEDMIIMSFSKSVTLLAFGLILTYFV